MSHDHAADDVDPSTDLASGATTNRRDLLKGAAGLAAAASIATIAATASTAAAAPTTAPRGNYCVLAGIGEFAVFDLDLGGSTAYTFGNRTSASRPALSPVSLTRETDTSSPALFRSLVSGARIPSATITVANVDGIVQTAYDFVGVFVSEMITRVSEDGRPVEQLSFVYEVITVNQLGAASVTWNAVQARLV